MRFALPFLFLFVISLNSSAQFSDDFSDGNYTINPAWVGDTASYVVNNGELQLMAPSAGRFQMATSSGAIWNAFWECKVRMDFNPSSSNFGRFYLISDTAILSGNLNGYFIQFGGSSDEVSLYRQDGTSIVEIVDGRDKTLDKSINSFLVRAERDSLGNWKLFSDTSASLSGFQLEGNTRDTTYEKAQYSGVFCQNTITRADKFFFDDFMVQGKAIVDTTPARLVSAGFINQTQIKLEYNEKLAQASSAPGNFALSGGLGTPSMVSLDHDELTLQWAGGVNNGSKVELIIDGITDVAGNPSPRDTLILTYYQPQQYDLLITEVFADPDPAVGLPQHEFLELHNRSAFSINLKGMLLSDATSTEILPQHTLDTGSYLIICKPEAVADYQGAGSVIGLDGFPSLNNDSDQIRIEDSLGNLLHFVNYEKSWYQDPLKEDGGWSLEMMDLDFPCSGQANWKASENLRGGSPGEKNSVIANNPDTQAPRLLQTVLNNASSIKLIFDESLQHLSLADSSKFMLTPSPGGVQSISVVAVSFNEVDIRLSSPLQPGIEYELKILDIEDCSGNPGSSEARLGISEEPASLDVIVNEILFEPRSGGSDFVEIYNRSNKILRLDQLRIATLDETGQIRDLEMLSEEAVLFFPGDYLALTREPDNVRLEYPLSRKEALLKMSLPSLPSDQGHIALYSFRAELLDELNYSSDWHYDLLNETRGVSLERLAFDEPTQEMSNWFSAASAAGFATPGYKNSQVPGAANIRNVEISIDNRTISPNGDGYVDFLKVNYHFDEPGYSASGLIFDSGGRLVRSLFRSQLMQQKGSFVWDGLSDAGREVRTGPYILFLEVYHPNGSVLLFKEGLVVNNL